MIVVPAQAARAGRRRPAAVVAVVTLLVGAGLAAGLLGTRQPPPLLLVQDLRPGAGYGQLAVVPAGDPGAARRSTGLTCDRVAQGGGHGLCLAGGTAAPAGERLLFLDAASRVVHEIPLAGHPGPVAVSADGRRGAATVLVVDPAADDDDGELPPRTVIVDMAAGTVSADLATFTVLRDGVPVHDPDAAFRGVTFGADPDAFYATMTLDGAAWLARGDLAARTLTVLRAGVVDPALSPDGTRIAYAHAEGGAVWRYHVLDLRTGVDRALAETRSLAEQPAWLDDATVLYGVPDAPHAVFSVPADGGGRPRELVPDALWPSVVAAGSTAGTTPPAPITVAALAPAGVRAGAAFTQSVTVAAPGPADVHDVVVETVLSGPGRVVGATASAPAGSGGQGCTVLRDAGRVRCGTGLLPSGATWTVTVTVVGERVGTVVGDVVASTDRGAADVVPAVTTRVG